MSPLSFRNIFIFIYFPSFAFFLALQILQIYLVHFLPLIPFIGETRNQDRGIRHAHCYWGMLASGPSQLSENENT